MRKALIGAGGLAGELMSMIGCDLPCFVQDSFLVKPNPGVFPLSAFDPSLFEVCLAIADPVIRSRILEILPKETRFFSFIHDTAVCLTDKALIGEGAFIGCGAVVMNGVKLGKHVMLNRSNQIGHGSIVGDLFSGLPSSIISGNVVIGQRVMIGSNSVVLERIKVCDDVIVGAMSCVTRDILKSGIYFGSPAKIKE